jgi:hypothetical protein
LGCFRRGKIGYEPALGIHKGLEDVGINLQLKAIEVIFDFGLVYAG